MKINIFIITLTLIILASIFPFRVLAQQKQAGSSAAFLNTQLETEEDKRTMVLKSFLESHNSTLAPYASNFINEADKYSLDWRLVAAIAGVESTFAKQLPFNSYNAWGWGIYGNNVRYFKSYDEAIQTISKSLREDYINTWGARNVYQIGRFYAADTNWARKVTFFMNKIDQFALSNPSETLPLSL